MSERSIAHGVFTIERPCPDVTPRRAFLDGDDAAGSGERGALAGVYILRIITCGPFWESLRSRWSWIWRWRQASAVRQVRVVMREPGIGEERQMMALALGAGLAAAAGLGASGAAAAAGAAAARTTPARNKPNIGASCVFAGPIVRPRPRTRLGEVAPRRGFSLAAGPRRRARD